MFENRRSYNEMFVLYLVFFAIAILIIINNNFAMTVLICQKKRHRQIDVTVLLG